MTLAVTVGLATLRAGRPIHVPVNRVAGLAAHLSENELDGLSIVPSSVNPASGLWVVLRIQGPSA